MERKKRRNYSISFYNIYYVYIHAYILNYMYIISNKNLAKVYKRI